MVEFFKDVYGSNKSKFIRILLLTILSSVTAGVGVVMLIPMLSFLEISSEETGLFADVIAKFSNVPKWQLILVVLIAYILLMTLKSLISSILGVKEMEMVQSYLKNLRLRFYDAIAVSDWETFKSYKKTDLSNYFMNETGRISYVVMLFIHLFVIIITALINVIIAFFINVPMTLMVIGVGVAFVAVFKSVRTKARTFGENIQITNEHFFEEMTNQMNGIKEIRSYGVERKQYKLFEKRANEYEASQNKYRRLEVMPQFLLSVGSAIIVVAVFLVAYMGLNMSIGRIAVLVYIFARLWPSFSSAQSYLQEVMAILPVYKNMKDVINNLERNKVEESDSKSFDMNEGITFKNVSFSYADSEDPEDLIENISFEIKKGSVTAFVGKSGAGKSTLVDIVLGFLHPKSGEVAIDGVSIEEIGYSSLRKSVSYIPQDPILLNSTVRENLERFHTGATEEEMIAALKKAQAWDVVSKLSDGLDTVIGDRGIRLSGGERQRIVLARALMGSPKLLVLDEATSALDYENEKKIRDILIELKGELTVLLVAHRLSTIQSADHVIVIENGTITENGTYSELIINKEGYLGQMING